MSVRSFSALLLCVAATLGQTATARAYCRMTTSTARPSLAMPCVTDGLPLAWERRCMEYSIDMMGSPDLDRATLQTVVANSFDAWLQVSCGGELPGFEIRETTASDCREAEYRRNGGNVNTIAFVDDWTAHDYDPAAFAVTTVWHITATGEILDADMQLNQSLGPYGVCPMGGCPGAETGTAETADLQNIVTHELGHFFGIGHSEVPGATMYAVSRRGETNKRILRTDDVDALCAIYPPGTLPAECDFTPTGGLRLGCPSSDGGGGCGCRLNTAGHGSPWSSSLGLLVGATLLVRRRR